MSKTEVKFSFKDLLKRGIVMFFFIGTYTAIIQDKAVLDYFLKTEIIMQILFFTVVGGLLYSWITNKIINRNKDKNPD